MKKDTLPSTWDKKRELPMLRHFSNASFIFILVCFLFSPGRLVAQNCSVNANVNQTLCPTDPVTLLGSAAGMFNPASVLWTQIGGPAVIIDNPTSLTSNITGTTGGNSYTFRLFATCTDGILVFQDVVYTILPNIIANAGSDITGCPGSISLNANAPGAGEVGLWTIVGPSNGVVINNPANPNSTITLPDNNGGQTTLRWVITNTNGCFNADEVVVTNCGGTSPVDAGANQTLSNCYSLSNGATMNATRAGFCGTGLWEIVSGPNVPAIVNPGARNTMITGMVEGTYVFRWSVQGQCANGEDLVTITVPPPTADVTNAAVTSGNQTYCDSRTTTILQGTIPRFTNESVIWTQTGGPPANIISPNAPVTEVTGLDGVSTYTFTYTISNSATGCSRSANVTIAFSMASMVALTINDIFLNCNQTEATLAYSDSGPGAVEWRILTGPALISTSWQAAGPSPFIITDLNVAGTYVIELRKNTPIGAACTSASDQVLITVSRQPSLANAGTGQIVPCMVSEVNLAGNTPLTGAGTWTLVGGPNIPVIVDPLDKNTLVTGLIPGAYTFRWIVSGGYLCESYQEDVMVLVSNTPPSAANAGPDQTVCINTPVSLSADTPLPNETGTWSVSPGAGVAFSDVNAPDAVATGLAPNTVYTFTWTIENGCGTSSDNVLITANNTVGTDVALAGPDQCLPAGTTSITLAGNNPTVGTGQWTQFFGPSATIVNPAQYNTVVNGLTNGTYVFVWQNLSSGCSPTADTVVVTIDAMVSAANAGPDLPVCGTTATLQGNVPTVGTGTWTQLSGPGGAVITQPSSPTSPITGLTEGTYRFVWEIKNGACSSKDTVALLVSLPPPAAMAGPDQIICGNNTATLAANAVPDGYWTLVSGPSTPIFSNIQSPTSTISGLVFGVYVLQWNSKSRPFCPIETDQVQITVYPTANAGADQAYCEEIMAVNLIGSVGSTGAWTQLSGPNASVITPTASNSATASGLVPGIYTFQYQISEQGCVTTDQMTVTLSPPPTTANAGPDQDACEAISFTLAGNVPTTGMGTWSMLGGPGGGTFTPSVNTPNATFTPNPGVYGVYLLAWEIANGTCAVVDQVRITNYQNPTTAAAGPDQTVICATEVTMAGNNPTVGVGLWTVVSAPPAAPAPLIASPVLYNTSISNLVPGIYTFRWTTTNGPVCSPSLDDVQVTIEVQPTPAAAGPDQLLCNQSAATLAATPVVVGTGVWSVVSTPGGPAPTFGNPNDPATMINGLQYGTTVLRWTTTEGPCVSTDQVSITNYAPPTIASTAGTTANICFGQPMFLVGNTPTVGTGQWTQVSGSPVTILNSGSPNAQVIGFATGTYTFRWTIANGACPPSFSEVTVTSNPIPTQALANADQIYCDATSAVLAGNTPVVGTGTWSLVTGPNAVTFSNAGPNSPGATVNGLVPGSPNVYELQWTIAVGPCSTSDNMRITVWAVPTPANAGADLPLCNQNVINLSATPATIGTGMWTKVSGPAGTITSPTSAATTVTGTVQGTYVFRWTTANGPICPSSQNDVTVFNYADISGGPMSTSVCVGGFSTLNAAATGGSGTYTYQWESSPGNCALPTFTPISGADGPTYITPPLLSTTSYRVIIGDANSVCPPFTSACATVNVAPDPSINVQPSFATLCTGGNATFTVMGAGGTPGLNYQWQRSPAGAGSWTNVGTNSPSFNTGAITTTFDYRVVITSSGSGCDPVTSAVVTANVFPDPTIGTQLVGATFCAGGTHTMNIAATGGIPPGNVNYQWQISTTGTGSWSNVGTNSTTYTTAVLNATRHYRVLVTQTQSGCQTISATATVTVAPDPAITAQPAGGAVCMGGTRTLNVTATGGTPSLQYQWQMSTGDCSSPSWSDISGAMSNSYTPPPLSATTSYRVLISAAGNFCNPVTSNCATVTVVPDPAITVEPAGATICTGGTHTLSVTATGGTPSLQYQWQMSTGDCSSPAWSNISGAMGSSYTTPALSATTSYRVLISATGSGCDPVASNCATVTVVPDPVIGTQPVGATICSGGDHTMSVSALGNIPPGTLNYQWQISSTGTDGWSDVGTNGSTYTTIPITFTRYYRVIITQTASGCEAISSVATVTVVPDPTITAQPLSGAVCIGGTRMLSVTATGGTPSLQYQWQMSTGDCSSPSWSDISGEMSSSYTTPALSATTSYRVLISATGVDCDPVASNCATVTVVPDPAIDTQPVGATICTGGMHTLSVTATGGTPSLQYQWQMSTGDCSSPAWSNISGAMSSSYTTPALSATTSYRVLISASGSGCDPVTSNCATVTVVPDPAIDTQPVGATICNGGTHTLSVTATGGTPALQYQWQMSTGGCSSPTWSNISGAMSSSYTTPALSATTSYRVLISASGSGCDPVASNCATVTVLPDPAIDTQPVGATICNGGTHTLSVTATGGTPALQYQWQMSTGDCSSPGWSNISGAMSNSYTTPALSATTSYRVLVSATGVDCDPVASNCATVTVVPDPAIGTQPVGATICSGGDHTMSVLAMGDIPPGTLNYQWQISLTGTDGWSDVGTNSSSYTTTALASTRHYRVIVTQTASGCETISSVATVTVVADPAITDQPVGATICSGGTHGLSVTATGGTPSLQYQWQMSTGDCSSPSWSNISGAMSSSYTTPALSATTSYRVLISATGVDCDPVASACATVTVQPNPTINVQPQSGVYCVEDVATFSAGGTAQAGGSLSFQWQVSTDGGGTWSNLTEIAPYTGTDATTLIIAPVPLSVNMYQYRLVVSENALTTCTASSQPAMIIVNSCYALGNRVWLDANNNGLLDFGENGMDNVDVQLLDSFGAPTDNPNIPGFQPYVVTTAGGGYYLFFNILEGDYIVEVTGGTGTPLNGYFSSTINGGDPDVNPADNDDNGNITAGSNVRSDVVTIGPGNSEPIGETDIQPGGSNQADNRSNLTVDFGFFAPVFVGDYVWVDLNANGLQDALEPPLPGVIVTIFNTATNSVVASDAAGNAITGMTTTNAMGLYEFTNLLPANYYVVFDISTAANPEYYQLTLANQGPDTNDSDADSVTGQTEPTGFLYSGMSYPDLDAGVVCLISANITPMQLSICSTRKVELSTLGASITPNTLNGVWGTSGTGMFLAADQATVNANFLQAGGGAAFYMPSAADIAAGAVTLTLTTNAPPAGVVCPGASDAVQVIILRVDCGSFPWNGN